MNLVPVTLLEAKRFVNEQHRHNEAPVGWKFGVGLERDGELVGIAIVGRPVARRLDQRLDVEITRCTTLGDRNACSMLYGAACRAAKALGYRDAYTYTTDGEDGSSVRAAGFTLDADLTPTRGDWNNATRPRQAETLFGARKRQPGSKRWVRRLNSHALRSAA